jgi:hypothetical protein
MSKPLTPAQVKVLKSLYYAPTGTVIAFANDPTIKRLLALGLITFTPTAFGAGTIARRGGA